MSQRIVPSPEEITLAGERLVASALTDRQLVELDQWTRAQMIRAASESVPPDDPSWDRVVAVAVRESLRVTWLNSSASRTHSGYARVIWASCVAKAPQLTEGRVSELLRDSELLEQRVFNEVYQRLNYPVRREAKPDGPDPQAPA